MAGFELRLSGPTAYAQNDSAIGGLEPLFFHILARGDCTYPQELGNSGDPSNYTGGQEP